MQFLKKKFSVLILSFVVLTVISASCAYAKTIAIKVTNNTNKKISLAFARENGYNDNNNTTKGWFNVNPYETKTFTPFNYDEDDNYYWYAFAGKVVWKGDLFSGWIDPKSAFNCKNGKKIPGGKIVGFRHLKESNGKASIKLTLK